MDNSSIYTFFITLRERVIRATLPVVALGLIWYGGSLMHEAVGPIAVGALLWIDLTIASLTD